MTTSADAHFIGVGGNNSIDGSLCVGFDCVAEEAFGFDTIRLKENNLRLDFQDTSSAAAFPPNDWRIIINDSSNGGASHFSIEDRSAGNQVIRVFAGARNNALVVDSQGDLGLGTTTPAVDIDIKTGNTPTVRLQQDGTAGFTPQTWDMAGNETNYFIRDATNGSKLPFRIRPNSPTSAIELDVTVTTLNDDQQDLDLRVEGDAEENLIYADADTDRVGVGTDAPTSRLHVSSDTTTVLELDNTGGGVGFIMDANADDTDFWQMTATNNDNVFRINRTGGATEMEIDSSGNLTVSGSLFSSGGTCGGGCDAVFDADYALPTIEEHATAMWDVGFLPNVGPTPENAQINVSDKLGRMLNELEHAHIYIEQLHERIARLEMLVEAN